MGYYKHCFQKAAIKQSKSIYYLNIVLNLQSIHGTTPPCEKVVTENTDPKPVFLLNPVDSA